MTARGFFSGFRTAVLYVEGFGAYLAFGLHSCFKQGASTSDSRTRTGQAWIPARSPTEAKPKSTAAEQTNTTNYCNHTCYYHYYYYYFYYYYYYCIANNRNPTDWPKPDTNREEV